MGVRAQRTGTGLIWGERRYKQEATPLPALLLLHPLLGCCLFQKERLEPPRASHELQARRNEAPRATGMWCRVCGGQGQLSWGRAATRLAADTVAGAAQNPVLDASHGTQLGTIGGEG